MLGKDKREDNMLRKITTPTLIVATILLLGGYDLFAQTRLRFRRGSTSTSVSGKLAPGGSRSFVLAASSGQTLTANISSGNGRVLFEDGGTSTEFQTDRGDNYISISNNGGRTTNFTLTVSIR